MTACPALQDLSETGLADTLTGIDCRLNGVVSLGYDRLFASHGAFGAALTGLLTLFVAFMAYGLITGLTRLSLTALTPRVMAFGLVLTFATAWPAYQAVVYGLLTRGPDEIASAFMGGHSGAIQAFVGRLDNLLSGFVDLAQHLSAQGQGQGQGKDPNLQMAGKLAWASAISLMLTTVGVLVVVRVVLAVLLALGPLFIVFALFGATRGLFEGWLKTTVAFAFAPMLVVLGGSAAMVVLAPMLAAIEQDPAGAVAEMRPIMVLFLATIVYAALLLALAWTAFSLTRNWRMPFSQAATAHGELAPLHQGPGSASSANLSSPPQAPPVRPMDQAGNRVGAVLSAVMREQGRQPPPDVRVDITSSSAAAAPSGRRTPREARSEGRRAEGLGQTFRPQSQSQTLAGAIGS